MKEEDRQILWLDYFDSSYSRSEGRRVPINMAVKSPTLDELLKAVKAIGLDGIAFEAKHPKRPRRKSGYVSVPKVMKKQELLIKVAKSLMEVRGRAR